MSDRLGLAGMPFPAWLAGLLAAGVETLQLREKDLDDRDLWALALEARRFFPPPGRLLVNGRMDVAQAVGAEGVHLPADGVPVAALRGRFGPTPLLGVSTHRLEEVAAAHEAGADYVTFGPVYPTPSKAEYGPPVGLDALARAAVVGIPVLALGGVTLESFGELAAAGAAGVAGIRMFHDLTRLPDLVAAARHAFVRPA